MPTLADIATPVRWRGVDPAGEVGRELGDVHGVLDARAQPIARTAREIAGNGDEAADADDHETGH